METQHQLEDADLNKTQEELDQEWDKLIRAFHNAHTAALLVASERRKQAAARRSAARGARIRRAPRQYRSLR